MAGTDIGNGTDDAAARQAAEVAVELSEAGGQADRRRVAGSLQAVAAGAASAVTNAAASARRGADSAARRGAATARKGAATARRGAGSASRGVTSGMNWLTTQVIAMGPRLRIRDQATLRAHYPGQSDDEIAQRLIEHAAGAAAAVGGTIGAWAALPALPAFPAEVAAETLAVVGIEVKLVAELHELYGSGAAGTGTERARAYLGSWASRRGVYQVDGGLLLIAGSPLARQLTRRLAARVRRSTFSLAPLFTGALAGAVLNRRETRLLGRQIRDELRQRHRIARPAAKAAVAPDARSGRPVRGDDAPYPPEEAP
ncbi:MAG TPA: hypothetical protein VFO01_04285 [Trebonia sp.]|nr:hypothetical protein [Trebonia sp.]